MIVGTHADVAVTDERHSATDTSMVIVDTVTAKFTDDFDVVRRLFVINCLRPTYAELKALRLCLAEMRTATVSVSMRDYNLSTTTISDGRTIMVSCSLSAHTCLPIYDVISVLYVIYI